MLRCPVTQLALEVRVAGNDEVWAPFRSNGPRPVGPTPTVLRTVSGDFAYPIVDGIPILIAPERLTKLGDGGRVDLSDSRYAEAYDLRSALLV